MLPWNEEEGGWWERKKMEEINPHTMRITAYQFTTHALELITTQSQSLWLCLRIGKQCLMTANWKTKNNEILEGDHLREVRSPEVSCCSRAKDREGGWVGRTRGEGRSAPGQLSMPLGWDKERWNFRTGFHFLRDPISPDKRHTRFVRGPRLLDTSRNILHWEDPRTYRVIELDLQSSS